MRRGPLILALLLLIAGAAPRAHDAFVLPAPEQARAGAACRLLYHVTDVFPGEPRAFPVERVLSLTLVAPDGRASDLPLAPLTGDPTAPVFTPATAGTHAILLATSESFIEIEAEKFADYLKHEGHERLVGEAAALARPGREAYRRWLKLLVAVASPGGSGGAPAGGQAHSRAATTPLGAPVELVPVQDPATLRPGDTLELMALVDGRPVQGALVSATRAGARVEHDTYLHQARTDVAGRVRFILDAPGAWLTRFTVMARVEEEKVDWRSRWAALTFIVPEAAPAQAGTTRPVARASWRRAAPGPSVMHAALVTSAGAPLAGPVQVVRVWDGDTISVRPAGAKKPEERVRIIGIDTPEMGNRDRRAEPGAGQAKARVESWIQGRALRLTLEPRNERDRHRDRYERLLAYVDDGRGGDLGLTLVREGLARVYRNYTFARKAAYEAAEREARTSRRGLWAADTAAAYPVERDAGAPGFLVRHEGGDLWAICAAGRARTGVPGAELPGVLRRAAGIARTQRGAALARQLESAGFVAVGGCGSTVE